MFYVFYSCIHVTLCHQLYCAHVFYMYFVLYMYSCFSLFVYIGPAWKLTYIYCGCSIPIQSYLSNNYVYAVKQSIYSKHTVSCTYQSAPQHNARSCVLGHVHFTYKVDQLVFSMMQEDHAASSSVSQLPHVAGQLHTPCLFHLVRSEGCTARNQVFSTPILELLFWYFQQWDL